jgi:hypothetical protein
MRYAIRILARCVAHVPALALTASVGAAQDSLLVRTLEANRYPFQLVDGRLEGRGAEWLITEGAASRFVGIGEEHGIAPIPGFVAAYFTALGQHGYRHLAVEVGAMTGRLLDSLAAHGAEAIGDFQRAHPPGFPFFVLRDEAEMAVAIRRAMPAARIWGIDYDILGDRYLLPRLERAAPPGPARDTVRAIRAMADSGLRRAVREGNPMHVMLFSAPPEPFERLRAALRPVAGSEADIAISTMQETAAINRLFLSGRNWESNHRRAGLITHWYMQHYRAAQAGGDSAPRVMVKLGYNHLYRGLNQTRQYDVGALISQLAVAEGGSSFHLLVIAGPGGRRAQFQPQRMEYDSLPTSEFPREEFGRLLHEGAWTVFDLRPLRALIHDNRRRLVVSERLFDLVFNFDALLIVPGAVPSRPFEGVHEATRAAGR